MNDAPFLANVCASWLCCLQPLTVGAVCYWVGRHGGVRPAISNLLDRLGVPRLS
jgi:hypothetical protein